MVHTKNMETPKEDKSVKNNYCRSCKRYHRNHEGCACPVCNSKLSTFKPRKTYLVKDEIKRRVETGKMMNINRNIEHHNSEFRMMSKRINDLEARYIQMINLLKELLNYTAGRQKKKVTMKTIVEYITKVVNEPPEGDIDLVDEIINYKEIK